MRIIMALLSAFALAAAAHGAIPAGTWQMTAEGRTVLTMTVAPDGRTGKASKPKDTTFDDGRLLSGMKPGIDDRTLEAVEIGADEVTFKRTGDKIDVRLKLRELDDRHAELIVSSPMGRTAPMPLVKAVDPVLATGWDDRPYVVDQRWPDNAEMEAIYIADQADRADPAKIDWAIVTPRDNARREQTKALLDKGALRSGQDFYAAAFVFQHGDTASDFLLAHSLALASAARGFPPSAWIGAATLDRYLLKIGQPQIYGTQFFAKKGEKAHQGAYDRTLAPDPVRTALGVPTLAEQEADRQEWDERMNPKE